MCNGFLAHGPASAIQQSAFTGRESNPRLQGYYSLPKWMVLISHPHTHTHTFLDFNPPTHAYMV